jgi:hypothetical protein
VFAESSPRIQAQLRKIGISDEVTFLLTDAIVLPQMPNFCPLNRLMAQHTNEMLINSVLPERTAPSHITASRSQKGDASHHHVRS